MPQAESPVQFGDYVLLNCLGRGGMGEVWKAVRRSDPTQVFVIKRVLSHLLSDPAAIQMFEHEARLCARLKHPNIVQMREYGEVDGECYLAMDCVHGVDLWRLMREQRRHGPGDPGFAAYVMAGVCSALDSAHRLTDDDGAPLNVVHRDVSPSNVMVSFAGETKLLDFGIAKALAVVADVRTQTGALKGKLGYMSPEQVEGGRRLDHRSDQFSAGVVLHELLTNERLFRGDTEIDTIALVRDAMAVAPSSRNPRVPPELDALCLRAIARDPNDRHADCGTLATQLAEIAAQLGWDQAKSVRLLDELFPGGSTEVTRVSLQLPSDAPIGTASVALDARAQRPSRRARWIALGAGVLAASALGLRWWPTHSAPPVATPAPGVAVASTAHIEIVSAPSGAEVFLGAESESRGRTPLALEVIQSEATQAVVLRREGYERAVSSFVPDRDSKLQITLTPVAAAAVAAPHKLSRVRSAPKPQHHPKAAKPTDLRRGAVVDPFGT